ncbi:uncharacterized protein [Leptinotarsa decemlineata]|uniref:uncharacterized protein n=1 Tax=Leptinotarsa decemlineata TaxID=7539 RepID=UPI003D30C8B4
MYVELYSNRRIPNIQMFTPLERNLRDYGAFDTEKTRKCVVTGSVRNQINVMGLAHYKNYANQDCSLRGISHEMVISVKSTRTILKKNEYKCFRIRKVHHLNERDYGRRVRFAKWLGRRNRKVGNICKNIIWMDESKFTNNRWFNRNIIGGIIQMNICIGKPVSKNGSE